MARTADLLACVVACSTILLLSLAPRGAAIGNEPTELWWAPGASSAAVESSGAAYLVWNSGDGSSKFEHVSPDGSVVWSKILTGASRITKVFVLGDAVWGIGGGQLRRLNSNGETLWAFPTPMGVYDMDVDAHGNLYLAEWESVASFTSTGILRWRTVLPKYHNPQLDVAGDHVAVSYAARTALLSTEGSVTWEAPHSGDVAVDLDGSVFLVNWQRTLALSPAGTVIWSLAVPGERIAFDGHGFLVTVRDEHMFPSTRVVTTSLEKHDFIVTRLSTSGTLVANFTRSLGFSWGRSTALATLSFNEDKFLISDLYGETVVFSDAAICAELSPAAACLWTAPPSKTPRVPSDVSTGSARCRAEPPPQPVRSQTDLPFCTSIGTTASCAEGYCITMGLTSASCADPAGSLTGSCAAVAPLGSASCGANICLAVGSGGEAQCRSIVYCVAIGDHAQCDGSCPLTIGLHGANGRGPTIAVVGDSSCHGGPCLSVVGSHACTDPTMTCSGVSAYDTRGCDEGPCTRFKLHPPLTNIEAEDEIDWPVGLPLAP